MQLSLTFSRPLSQPLAPNHVIITGFPVQAAAHCPGIGQADSGYLCLYFPTASGVDLNTADIRTDLAGRFGVLLTWHVKQNFTSGYVAVSYATTAG